VNATVSFRSPRGEILYQDSDDHHRNALLRLLGLSQSSFESWLLEAERSTRDGLLARLEEGFTRLRADPGANRIGPTAPDLEGGPLGHSGKLWHASIAESPDFGVARSRDQSWGWLVRHTRQGWVREDSPPAYEESYFEGDPTQAGGYGAYAAQSGWRLEKAARQLHEIRTRMGIIHPGRALDIGSGYGYFRKALNDAGFAHDGIEISEHARAVANSLYGFSTLGGTLDDHAREIEGRYDLITLWDVIEHVADPVALLSHVERCLAPEGAVAIKTPNLDCPEAEVFGPYYHSLKREHLVYFTPRSLDQAAGLAGLGRGIISSVSHLLVGFVGTTQTNEWEKAGRGADIMAFFRR
jgi:SAM-dependent methyltransferase